MRILRFSVLALFSASCYHIDQKPTKAYGVQGMETTDRLPLQHNFDTLGLKFVNAPSDDSAYSKALDAMLEFDCEESMDSSTVFSALSKNDIRYLTVSFLRIYNDSAEINIELFDLRYEHKRRKQLGKYNLLLNEKLLKEVICKFYHK